MSKSKTRGPNNFADDLESLLQDEDVGLDTYSWAAVPSPAPTPLETETEAKLGPNRVQTEAKLRPNQSPTAAVKEETEAKPGTKLRPHSRPNRGQTGAKPRPNRGQIPSTEHGLSALVGLQRQILLMLHASCQINRSSQTEALAVEHITAACKTTYHAARKALQRLEQKGFIRRAYYKVGRGGWTIYELPDDVFHAVLKDTPNLKTEAKLGSNRGQIEAKPGTELGTELRPTPPSSSRDLNLNISSTTTDDLDPDTLSKLAEWGITESVLARCAQLVPSTGPTGMYRDVLIDTARRFPVFMESESGKGIRNPKAFFIELAKQVGSGVRPLDGVETDEEKEMRRVMDALIKKAQSVRAEREAAERALFESEYEAWVSSLGVHERALIAPESVVVQRGNVAEEKLLKNHFEQEIWPQLIKSHRKAQY